MRSSLERVEKPEATVSASERGSLPKMELRTSQKSSLCSPFSWRISASSSGVGSAFW